MSHHAAVWEQLRTCLDCIHSNKHPVPLPQLHTLTSCSVFPPPLSSPPCSPTPSLPYLLFPSPLLVLSSKVHSRNKSITQLHTVTSAHTYTLLILYVCTHTQHTYVCTYTICDLRATYLHSVEYIHALYHYIHVLFEGSNIQQK